MMNPCNHYALSRIGTRALIKANESVEALVAPSADIYETSDAFIVKLEMPGAQKETISVNTQPGQLSIKAAIAGQSEAMNVVVNEIGKKSYVRQFNLGEGVDHQGTEAEFSDGILTIRLPKSEQFKAREIIIN